MTGRWWLLALLACGPAEDARPEVTDASDTTDASDSPPERPPLVARLVAGAPAPCADPTGRELLGAFSRQSIPSRPVSRTWLWGGGGALGDLDGDGDLDLVMSGETGVTIYLWDGAALTAYLTFEDTAYAVGASLADADDDGDLDLLVLRYDRVSRLYRNQGGLSFRDVSRVSGLPEVARTATTSSWGDVDGDGDLDLFIGRFGNPDFSEGVDPSSYAPGYRSSLLINNGSGVFSDASDRLPDVVHDGYTHAGGFVDLNGDMAPELYVVNDFGEAYPSVLMWNRGGTLVADDGAAGLNLIATGMGLGIGDLNQDTIPDLFVPQWNDLTLHLSGGGAWFEASAVLGLEMDAARAQRVAWGGEMADLDSDGQLEIMAVYGWVDTEARFRAPRQQPDALYVMQPDGRFRDDAARWSMEDWTAGRGVLFGDIDGNGWMDLVRPNLDGDHAVYLARCGANGWLKVRLEQPAPNVDAVGARIVVNAGGRVLTRWILAGGTGFGSSLPLEAVFGVGAAAVADEITVSWPDGAVDRFRDVDVNQTVTVVREAEAP